MKRKTVAVLILIVSITSLAKAQESVFFFDTALQAEVEFALEIDHPPTTDDMLNLIFLDAKELDIFDLTGLEKATNLFLLDLATNLIQDLSPIAGLEELRWLYLEENLIEDISPLSAMTKLELLGLDNNEITDISPLEEKQSLTTLWLFNNYVTDISPIADSGSLIELDLGYNLISDISTIAAFENLEELALDGNTLNTPAYCSYLPQISINNPTMTNENFLYDPNPNPITNDCSTDVADLAGWTQNWLDINCTSSNDFCNGADLDHVNNVDIKDFAHFAKLWLNEI